MLKTLSLLGMMAGATSGFGTLCGSNAATRKAAPLEFPAASEVPPNLKVVFLGDAGSGNEQRQVLTMAKEWGAEAIVHSGDFEYKNDPDLFEEQLNAVLGPNYPYFASIGNHDLWKWSGHEQKLKARLQNSGYASNCTGEIGVNMACNIKGLYVVLSGVGTRGDDHEEFMDEAFGSSEAIWKVASWHKNQRKMQIGGKFDETGWEVYDLARKHGAIIATGHEHSYCRSHIMSDMEDQVIVNTNSTLNVREGETFVFVSGLGGKEVRDWNDKLVENPWWAAVGASDNGILDGALFCTFNVNGESRLANCFFRDTSGKVWDNFDIVNHNADSREVAKARRAAVEARRPACRSRWVEVPVSSALGDALENHETGELICDAKIASFSSKATASFRFENLPLSARSKVLQAHLQVYGAATDGSAGADFVISASRGLPASASSPASCQRELFAPASAPSSSVSWEQEDEEWEDYNVWVSPDLGQLVSEVVGQSGWSKGDTLLLQMTGQNGKEFFAFDTSACVAPTLAIEVLTC